MPFEPLGYRSEHDSGKRDNDEADEQRVRLERLSAISDHESDTFAGTQHFANDDADQSDGNTLTHSRQNETARIRESPAS